MSASTVTATIARQFNAIAPAAVKVAGKTYRVGKLPAVYDNAAGSVVFHFVGRKRRGAILADKVAVTVAYDAASDLYNVAVVHCDGATLDNHEIVSANGVYAESFANLDTFIAQA